MLRQNRLKELLYYNLSSGDFVWLVSASNAIKVGSQAGSPDKDGYIIIQIDGKKYKAHRLAWLYVHGTWPENEIDHENTIKHHNQISNLRPATHAENLANTPHRAVNKLKVKNIHYVARTNRYILQMMLDGKKKHLGCFRTLEEAVTKRDTVASQQHGKFSRTDDFQQPCILSLHPTQ